MEVKIPIFPKVRKILFFTLSQNWMNGINVRDLMRWYDTCLDERGLGCCESREGKNAVGW